jgi:hypothetical protein
MYWVILSSVLFPESVLTVLDFPYSVFPGLFVLCTFFRFCVKKCLYKNVRLFAFLTVKAVVVYQSNI